MQTQTDLERTKGAALAWSDELGDKFKLNQEAKQNLFPDSKRWVIATWHWTFSGSSGYSVRSSDDDISNLLNEMSSMSEGGHDFKLYDNKTGNVYDFIA